MKETIQNGKHLLTLEELIDKKTALRMSVLNHMILSKKYLGMILWQLARSVMNY